MYALEFFTSASAKKSKMLFNNKVTYRNPLKVSAALITILLFHHTLIAVKYGLKCMYLLSKGYGKSQEKLILILSNITHL